MSSFPGGSGENIAYALLCGGAFVGAVSYVSELFQLLKYSSTWFTLSMSDILSLCIIYILLFSPFRHTALWFQIVLGTMSALLQLPPDPRQSGLPNHGHRKVS